MMGTLTKQDNRQHRPDCATARLTVNLVLSCPRTFQEEKDEETRKTDRDREETEKRDNGTTLKKETKNQDAYTKQVCKKERHHAHRLAE